MVKQKIVLQTFQLSHLAKRLVENYHKVFNKEKYVTIVIEKHF